MSSHWPDHLKALWDLSGQTLQAFDGHEWALQELGPGGRAIFRLPEVPFLQFNRLQISTVCGANYQLFTLGDGEDGLGASLLKPECRLEQVEEDDFSNVRDWKRDVSGCVVRQLRIGVDREDRAMALTIVSDDRCWTFLPGEAVEGKMLTFRWPDESILLFDDPAQVDDVPWSDRPRLIHFTVEPASLVPASDS